jgi:hypothetical protein
MGRSIEVGLEGFWDDLGGLEGCERFDKIYLVMGFNENGIEDSNLENWKSRR